MWKSRVRSTWSSSKPVRPRYTPPSLVWSSWLTKDRLADGRSDSRPRGRKSCAGIANHKRHHDQQRRKSKGFCRQLDAVRRPRHCTAATRPCRVASFKGRRRVSPTHRRGGAREAAVQDERGHAVRPRPDGRPREPQDEIKGPGTRAQGTEEAARGMVELHWQTAGWLLTARSKCRTR